MAFLQQSKSIEYDPNRTSRIALLYYADGAKSYIIARTDWKLAKQWFQVAKPLLRLVILCRWQIFPLVLLFITLSFVRDRGAKLVRSAGAFAQLTSKEGDYAIIKMPSGETRKILAACKATVGSVGNSDHGLEKSGKSRSF